MINAAQWKAAGPARPALLAGAGATSIPRPLVGEVQRVFGVPLRCQLGHDGDRTRACGPGRTTRRTGQLRAMGVLGRCVENRPALGHRDHPGVAPAACMYAAARSAWATLGRDSGALTVIAEHDDGWYDTGDLAIPDGRGGVRLMGRAGDRISGEGAGMIPVRRRRVRTAHPPRRRGHRPGRIPRRPRRRARLRSRRPGHLDRGRPRRAAQAPDRTRA